MPQATRLGDMSTGHDSCASRALVTASTNVNINGIPAGRNSDQYAAHGCDAHSTHQDSVSGGSATVFINGLSVARVGDSVSIGGTVASGSDNVYVGD